MRKIFSEKLKFLLLIGLYIFCFNCDNFKVKAAVTKFTNLQCEALDTSRLTFKECRLKLIKRGVVALNIHANILKPVTYMLLNLDLHKKANGYKPFLMNNTVNFCDFLKHDVQNLPVKIFYNFIRQYTNLNHSCPYEHDIIAKNLLLTEDKFRLLPLPSGDYLLKMNFIANNTVHAKINVYITRKE